MSVRISSFALVLLVHVEESGECELLYSDSLVVSAGCSFFGWQSLGGRVFFRVVGCGVCRAVRIS
jgi:hypothetical protein